MDASHWVAKPKGEMNVKVGLPTGMGSLASAGAHHSPFPSALSVGRRESSHVGTRKMVNYA